MKDWNKPLELCRLWAVPFKSMISMLVGLTIIIVVIAIGVGLMGAVEQLKIGCIA